MIASTLLLNEKYFLLVILLRFRLSVLARGCGHCRACAPPSSACAWFP